MTGVEIVRAREVLGWTRQRLANESGVPYARLCSLERYSPMSRGRGFRDGELEALQRVLGGVAVPAAPRPGWAEVPRLRVAEWRGLGRGDLVRTEDGDVCRFGFLVTTATEEYIEAYSTFNGGIRCLHPERVVAKTRRGWKRVLA